MLERLQIDMKQLDSPMLSITHPRSNTDNFFSAKSAVQDCIQPPHMVALQEVE
jgi:hypothetical protein